MAKERYYRYYIEPKDAFTNEVLSRELSPRYLCEEQKLWDGKLRPAWEVPEFFLIAFFQRSQKNQNLKFNAYIQEDNYPLQPCLFDATKSKLLKKKKR